jgi:hypothetical protein
MNKLMFRCALHAARWNTVTGLIDPGLTPHKTIAGKQRLVQSVFVTKICWLPGAAVFDFLAILACIPLFRDSPVEMAMVPCN